MDEEETIFGERWPDVYAELARFVEEIERDLADEPSPSESLDYPSHLIAAE